jgi:hypothetical protein
MTVAESAHQQQQNVAALAHTEKDESPPQQPRKESNCTLAAWLPKKASTTSTQAHMCMPRVGLGLLHPN